jgi:signal transduction histidine kinase
MLLDGIKRGSDRLTQLVADLLLVFELEAGITGQLFQSELEVCGDLGAVIALVVAGYEPEAGRKGVRLEVSIPPQIPPVRINHKCFSDAFGRLLSNAIKFSFGKSALVQVLVITEPERVGISVMDNGVGIATESMRHLFELFYQFDREKMEQQGLGIGLHIARQLIRLHGGDITVESQLGEGSTFTIWLPTLP